MAERDKGRVVRHRGGRLRRLIIAVVVLLVVGLAGTAWALRKDPASSPPAAAPSSAPPSTAGPLTATVVSPAATAQDLPAPERVRIGAIGVDAELEQIDVGAGGTLTPPTDFHRAGWFAKGAAPGDLGPAVIAGHVDTREGPAVFFRLRDLKPGDTIEVVRGPKTLSFQITATESFAKTAFPTNKVYGPTPVPELRLVTCGGDFDDGTGHYADNLIIYAVMV
ncbi:class F sortase [Virgisporangium aliadipatigenens]|uniref:class F sortase n=1 Tax=Virgisporangium aliadipatigenens TaxID=741659 RepID=UPI0019451EA7|nr:class F sortase [Virgisporangium aliadipatigenens]